MSQGTPAIVRPSVSLTGARIDGARGVTGDHGWIATFALVAVRGETGILVLKALDAAIDEGDAEVDARGEGSRYAGRIEPKLGVPALFV